MGSKDRRGSGLEAQVRLIAWEEDGSVRGHARTGQRDMG